MSNLLVISVVTIVNWGLSAVLFLNGDFGPAVAFLVAAAITQAAILAMLVWDATH